jgi:hypothetical protein
LFKLVRAHPEAAKGVGGSVCFYCKSEPRSLRISMYPRAIVPKKHKKRKRFVLVFSRSLC